MAQTTQTRTSVPFVDNTLHFVGEIPPPKRNNFGGVKTEEAVAYLGGPLGDAPPLA